MTPVEFNELKRGSGPSRGVQRIALALKGMDATSELYDEAVELARQGSLARARDRLRMLLCLDPHDGQAHLLLAKVFGAQGRWSDALAELEQATACGLSVPDSLRETIESRRDATQRSRSEKVMARTASELQALREEARRLRGENSRLEREVRDQGDKSRLWMSSTAVVSGLGLFTLMMATVFGGPETPVEVHEQALASQAPTAPATPETTLNPETEEPVVADLAASLETESDGQEPALAPPPEEDALPRIYTVRKGDNLSHISKKVYSTSTRWKEIQDANTATLNGGIDLQVGMKLIIPE